MRSWGANPSNKYGRVPRDSTAESPIDGPSRATTFIEVAKRPAFSGGYMIPCYPTP